MTIQRVRKYAVPIAALTVSSLLMPLVCVYAQDTTPGASAPSASATNPAPAASAPKSPADIAREFDELIPESLLPLPDTRLALPVSGFYTDPATNESRPVSPYPFVDPFFKNHLDALSDPRDAKQRYLLRTLPPTKINDQNKLLSPGFEGVSVYTNHPAPMPRTAPSTHYQICIDNKYQVGLQDLGVGEQVPGIQPPPVLFTTYVRTAQGIYPDPQTVGLEAEQPPGTNMLPTVYRNLIDRYGNEIPNTLPSHPNNPYNLHDGPPQISRLPTQSSPADDLRYVMESLYEDITGESPKRLWEYIEENGSEKGKSLYQHLREKVAQQMAKDDSLERRWSQMQIHTQWAIDLIEGNTGNGSKVPSNRAYAGFSLLNHSGHKRIGRVKPIFDDHGHVVGGNVNVHQIWFDGQIKADTMFYDFGWDDDPALWKPASPDSLASLPIPAEVPWTITYTVDVLNNGEDDFSPMTMYFDAPENLRATFEEYKKAALDNDVGDEAFFDKVDKSAFESARGFEEQSRVLNLSAAKGWSKENEQKVVQEVIRVSKARLQRLSQDPSTYPVPMVFNSPNPDKPFEKTNARLGLWNASMDQSFFPMEAGNRYVFKIKMAPAQYFNLTYTWGWRKHPPRAQSGENSHKRVPPRTPEQLAGLEIAQADFGCPRLLPPRLFSQLRISDHERLVFAGLEPGGAAFGDRGQNEPPLSEQYADEPIPITLLTGHAENPPGPARIGYINSLLTLDTSTPAWQQVPHTLRDFIEGPSAIAGSTFREAWSERQTQLDALNQQIADSTTNPDQLPALHQERQALTNEMLSLAMAFNRQLFTLSGDNQAELDQLREERTKLQSMRFMIMSNFPFFQKKSLGSKDAINMIGDLAPAKRMWRAFGEMNGKVSPEAVPTDEATRLELGYRMLDLILESRSAFLDWQNRTKLPSGLKPDPRSDLTLLYVNNTIYGEFLDGGQHDYTKWRKRGDAVKVTLINGDYFPHGYLNVDFGTNRGWENQWKPTLALGGPGMFFSFGRFNWKFNTEPGAIGVPPAVKQKYIEDGNQYKVFSVDRIVSQEWVSETVGLPSVPRRILRLGLDDGTTEDLAPGQAIVKRLGRELGNLNDPDDVFYVVVEDIVMTGPPTALSQAGGAVYDNTVPDSVRPFVHRVWIEMNHEPGKRVRFYQFDPLHHDVAIFSLH